MRIITGRFKGRRLKSNPGMTTRPILDRAKQMLFDRLESDIKNARVLDLFAGTGSMGLEALSRDARSCVFIEQDHKAFELLQENVRHIGADSLSLCWRTDALRSSFRPRGVVDFFPYDVIFFDPPYPLASAELKPDTVMHKSLIRLASPEVSAEKALLVVRIPEHFEPVLPDVWFRTDLELAVGSMRMRFYEKKPV